jgi:hypothetical protein
LLLYGDVYAQKERQKKRGMQIQTPAGIYAKNYWKVGD